LNTYSPFQPWPSELTGSAEAGVDPVVPEPGLVLEALQRRVRDVLAALGAGEQAVDDGGDELDVAVLLGRDVGDQVVERLDLLAAAEVERLVRVVHQRRHLAEAAAEQLLHVSRGGGIGIGRRGQLDLEAVDSEDHGRLLSSGTTGGCGSRAFAVGRPGRRQAWLTDLLPLPFEPA
jgi:hypothetical protein